MVATILKGVWFFSLLASIASLLYVYASLPESVQLNSQEPILAVSRSTIFYVVVAALAILNALVFVMRSVFSSSSEFFKAWSYGLISLLNLFFMVVMQFINLLNSSEKYNYGQIGFIIYTSVVLLVLWSVAYPVYYLSRRLSNKQTV